MTRATSTKHCKHEWEIYWVEGKVGRTYDKMEDSDIKSFSVCKLCGDISYFRDSDYRVRVIKGNVSTCTVGDIIHSWPEEC